MRDHRAVLTPSLSLAGPMGLAIFGDTIRWLVDSCFANPGYSQDILVPSIAAYFVWRAWLAFRSCAPDNRGLLLLAAALSA